MTKNIWKYTLEFTDEVQIVSFKKYWTSKLLCAKRQGNDIVVYIEVNDKEPQYIEQYPIKKPYEIYYFKIYATGYSNILFNFNYLDTVMFEDKGLVWHVYFMKRNNVNRIIKGAITR